MFFYQIGLFLYQKLEGKIWKSTVNVYVKTIYIVNRLSFIKKTTTNPRLHKKLLDFALSQRWYVTIARFVLYWFQGIILGGNVNLNLKTASYVERYPLYTVRYIEVLLEEFDRHFICFLRKMCASKRFPLIKDVCKEVLI